jgi:integron integrase
MQLGNTPLMVATPESPHPPKLLEQVVARLRVKHYSLRTEQVYVDWIKRFVWFHGKRHPKDMGAAEIEAFLSNLAVERAVSASTQNQAKSALLFLYKEVLQLELPWLDNVTQAKAPKRLPVVMTQNEVRAVLARMDGTVWLICSLLYGSGLRIMECLRMRVKDVDFERCEILVREGKGFKDRVTMLPASLVQPLKQQLERVKTLHDEDVLKGYGDVFMPTALDAKYPKAGQSWNWQYIFPSRNLSVDPRSGVVRRHHSDEKVIQRAVKKAVTAAEITKLATPHTFRHYPESRNMPSEIGGPRTGVEFRSIALCLQSAYSMAL